MSAIVTDGAALLAWVTENHPGETFIDIRPAFQHKLLESAKKHGEAVDSATGEIVPGIGFVTGDPYISYRGERGSVEVIAERWHEIAGPSLLDGAE